MQATPHHYNLERDAEAIRNNATCNLGRFSLCALRELTANMHPLSGSGFQWRTRATAEVKIVADGISTFGVKTFCRSLHAGSLECALTVVVFFVESLSSLTRLLESGA